MTGAASVHEPSAATWASNTSLDELAAWIRGLSDVVVLTHIKPDGDAIGSAIGLTRAIVESRGGSSAGLTGVLSPAQAWLSGPLPGWAGRIAALAKHSVIDEGQNVPGASNPDGVLVVDTGSWTQLRPFAEWLRPRASRTAVIDHHLSGDAEVGKRRHIDTGAAAACEIVASLACKLLGVRTAASLPPTVAEPLYLGIATDTGWFRHSNVSPRTLRVAADLLETGISPGSLFELIEMQDRPARLRLLRRALETLEYFDEHSIAVMTLKASDFSDTGASPGDSGGFHEIVKTVEKVRVTVVLQEVESGGVMATKLSMRSKTGEPFIDVNEVAKSLGGGGHAQAAGARLLMPIGEAKAAVVRAIRERVA